jgi:hypothetical protein
VVDKRLPGVAKQKVRIFRLLSFVEDNVQIYFSHSSLPRFFLHVHVHKQSTPLGVNFFFPTY